MVLAETLPMMTTVLTWALLLDLAVAGASGIRLVTSFCKGPSLLVLLVKASIAHARHTTPSLLLYSHISGSLLLLTLSFFVWKSLLLLGCFLVLGI